MPISASLVQLAQEARRHFARRQQAQPGLHARLAPVACARLHRVSAVSRISRRQPGGARKLHQRDLDQSHQVLPRSRITSIISATAWCCRLPRRRRQPLPGLVGRLLDRRRAVHHCHRCCGARFPIPTATTSAFLRPISIPTCSPRPRSGEYPLRGIEDVPRQYREFFERGRPRREARCSQATTFAR